MDRFTFRINELRKEIISEIVNVIKETNSTIFELPQDIDYSERVWHICYDKNGVPHECFVKMVIVDGEDIEVYSEDAYGCEFEHSTLCNFEVKEIDFLDLLYSNIVYVIQNQQQNEL